MFKHHPLTNCFSEVTLPTDTINHQPQLKSLRQELAETEAQIARASRLLKIADPDGWVMVLELDVRPWIEE